MSRSSESGKVLAKILYVLLALIVLGGAGFGVYWYVSAIERHSWDYTYGSGERRAEAVEVYSGRTGNEKVQGLVSARFMDILSHPAIHSVSGAELALFDKVFTTKPPPTEYFAVPALRFALRNDYPKAYTWQRLPGNDPLYATAAKAELAEVAGYPFSWDSKPAQLDAYVVSLLAALEKQGITADDPDVRNALVGCWLRYDLPVARPLVKKLDGKKELGDAVAAYLVVWSQVSSPPHATTVQILHEVARLKPEPTDELLKAIARFGALPEALEPFGAWGPEAAEQLAKIRDTISSTWDRNQATTLISKLGTTKLTANDISKSIQGLRRYDDNVPYRAPPGENDLLNVPYFYAPSYGSHIEEDIPGKVKELAEMGPGALPGMLDLWKFYPDHLEALVVSKALAKAAPAAFAETISKALDDFQPVAREVLDKNRIPKNIKSPLTPHLWRKMTPALREGLESLCSLENPPDAVVACLWRAVSCPEAAFSGMAGTKLRDKLPPDRFVRGLFLHLNQKAQYDLAEVRNLVSMLTEKEGAGPQVAASMKAILDVMKTPEAVPMIQKVVGLQALAKIGDASAKPVLERYLKDTSGYVDIAFKVDSKGNRYGETRTNRTFADLAKAALDAIP